MFSSRTSWCLSQNELTNLIQNRRQLGLATIDLTVSNPTSCGFEYPADLILGALATTENLVYRAEPKGLPGARQAVASYYSESIALVDPRQVILTSSTSEAYAFLFLILANQGDSVLVPRPSYPLLEFIATLNGIELCTYDLRYDGAWHVDMESVKKALTLAPRARAIVVVNPNNPTGSFLKRVELERLSEICLDRDMAIICDEVFGEYAFRSTDSIVRSVVGPRDILIFALNGLSKLAGLPQLKLSWICACGPASKLDEALGRLDVVADTYLSVNTPVQNALPNLLEHRHIVRNQILDRSRRNLETLQRLLRPGHTACTLLDVEGGWYAILRLPNTRSDEAWATRLLELDGVLVQPGFLFDFIGEAFVVVSLLSPPDSLDLGIWKLLRRVALDT